MPVYNDERFIRVALESLLSQTFRDFELVVSDNASTDRTPEICSRYARHDSRIRYIRQSRNIGPTENFNFLLRQARGDYFMWAASDDEWEPEFVQTLYNAVCSTERYIGAFAPYACIDESGCRIGAVRIFNYSSRSRIVRLVKLCLFYDDGCFYGFYRRRRIASMTVPTWSVNKNDPHNNAFPFLFRVLAAGDLALVGTSPLWHNRIKAAPAHFMREPGRAAIIYVAFVARKMEVLLRSIEYIYLGSSSAFLAVAATPALLCRFVYDCLRLPSQVLAKSLRRAPVDR